MKKKRFVYIHWKKKHWLTGIKPVHADWHSLGDTEFNHLDTAYSMGSVVLIGIYSTITWKRNWNWKIWKFLYRSSYFLLCMLVFEFCLYSGTSDLVYPSHPDLLNSAKSLICMRRGRVQWPFGCVATVGRGAWMLPRPKLTDLCMWLHECCWPWLTSFND